MGFDFEPFKDGLDHAGHEVIIGVGPEESVKVRLDRAERGYLLTVADTHDGEELLRGLFSCAPRLSRGMVDGWLASLAEDLVGTFRLGALARRLTPD